MAKLIFEYWRFPYLFLNIRRFDALFWEIGRSDKRLSKRLEIGILVKLLFRNIIRFDDFFCKLEYSSYFDLHNSCFANLGGNDTEPWENYCLSPSQSVIHYVMETIVRHIWFDVCGWNGDSSAWAYTHWLKCHQSGLLYRLQDRVFHLPS